MSRFKDNTLIGLTRTSGTLKTLAKYNGTAISGFRNTNPIVRAVKGIGVRAYISEYIAALSGDQLFYATNLSAFTSSYNAGKGRKITKIDDLNGVPYFFVEDGNKVEFYKWDEFVEREYLIYRWDNLTSYGITKFVSYIIISGTSNEKRVAFAFNGARLWQIFDDQLQDTAYDFSKPFEYGGELQTKGARWDGQYWFPGLYGKYAAVQYTPFANFGNRAYGYAVTGAYLKIAYLNSSKYEISGHVISSEFGHQIGGVDKLLNVANVNCNALATGQTIELYCSTDGGSSFTSIGKLQYGTDGAILKKQLYFPSGMVTKLWNWKAILAGPGTTTPTLKDVTFEYRPMPDLKKRWSLAIDASEQLQLLNRQTEERDPKALMSELWLEKEAKRTVVFEDVDSWNTTFLSAMTATDTSARVVSTRLMPPKGRMRVLKSNVVEEMTYTSAEGGSIRGIARAQKGTLARAYTSADGLDNFYTTIVTQIREQINNTDQNKTENIAQVMLLEV